MSFVSLLHKFNICKYRKCYSKKNCNGKGYVLTNHELFVCKKYYKGIKGDYNRIKFYNEKYGMKYFEPKFIPDGIFYTFVDTYYNDYSVARTFDDKNFYDLFFMI